MGRQTVVYARPVHVPPLHPPVRFALLTTAALLLAGCGTASQSTAPPEPRPAPPAPAPAPPRPAPPPPPTPPAPPAPLRAPAGSIAEEAWYPGPRIAEWTLTDGVRVLFHRTAAEPGVVRLRAFAAGGWLGADSLAPRALAAALAASDDGARTGLRLAVGAAEVRMEGRATPRTLPDLLRAVEAALMRARGAGSAARLTPELALDAALASIDPREIAAPDPAAVVRLDETLLGRPGAFAVLLAGDLPADTVRALAARALGRIRPSVLAPPDSGALPPVASRGLNVAVPGDGPRVLVGFRGRVPEPTASRSPADVVAGLDVLAAALIAAVERAAPDVRVEVRPSLVGTVATLVVEADGGGLDAQALGALVLRAAGGVGTSEAAVAAARGAAVTRARDNTPAVWLDRLELFARGRVDPRALADYAGQLRAVPAERVRLLAGAVLDATRAAVVEVEGGR